MIAGDLFAGAGGISEGFIKAGFEIGFAIDFEKVCCNTYQANHLDTYVKQGDICKIDPQKLLDDASLSKDDITLIVGGAPCQGFSTLGNKNEENPKNNLFKEYMKFVKHIIPEFIIFENVTGFYKLYGGKAMKAVVKGFSDLEYSVEYNVLNALNYGVPQRRERTLIIAYKEGYEFEWPKQTHDIVKKIDNWEGNIKTPITLEKALSDLPLIKAGTESSEYASEPNCDYQKDRRINSKTLTYHRAPSHGESLLETIGHVPEGGTIMNVPERLRPNKYFKNSYARLWWDRPSTTVTRNFGTPSSARCIHPLIDRGLTTREGARIQSFDDDYIFLGSWASKNLQIGNAVPPLLAKVIADSVMDSLINNQKKERRDERSEHEKED